MGKNKYVKVTNLSIAKEGNEWALSEGSLEGIANNIKKKQEEQSKAPATKNIAVFLLDHATVEKYIAIFRALILNLAQYQIDITDTLQIHNLLTFSDETLKLLSQQFQHQPDNNKNAPTNLKSPKNIHSLALAIGDELIAEVEDIYIATLYQVFLPNDGLTDFDCDLLEDIERKTARRSDENLSVLVTAINTRLSKKEEIDLFLDEKGQIKLPTFVRWDSYKNSPEFSDLVQLIKTFNEAGVFDETLAAKISKEHPIYASFLANARKDDHKLFKDYFQNNLTSALGRRNNHYKLHSSQKACSDDELSKGSREFVYEEAAIYFGNMAIRNQSKHVIYCGQQTGAMKGIWETFIQPTNPHLAVWRYPEKFSKVTVATLKEKLADAFVPPNVLERRKLDALLAPTNENNKNKTTTSDQNVNSNLETPTRKTRASSSSYAKLAQQIETASDNNNNISRNNNSNPINFVSKKSNNKLSSSAYAEINDLYHNLTKCSKSKLNQISIWITNELDKIEWELESLESELEPLPETLQAISRALVVKINALDDEDLNITPAEKDLLKYCRALVSKTNSFNEDLSAIIPKEKELLAEWLPCNLKGLSKTFTELQDKMGFYQLRKTRLSVLRNYNNEMLNLLDNAIKNPNGINKLINNNNLFQFNQNPLPPEDFQLLEKWVRFSLSELDDMASKSYEDVVDLTLYQKSLQVNAEHLVNTQKVILAALGQEHPSLLNESQMELFNVLKPCSAEVLNEFNAQYATDIQVNKSEQKQNAIRLNRATRALNVTLTAISQKEATHLNSTSLERSTSIDSATMLGYNPASITKIWNRQHSKNHVGSGSGSPPKHEFSNYPQFELRS